MMLFVFVLSLFSCERYLELKPDQKLVVPSTVQDLQALLNDPNTFFAHPGHGEMAAGDFYLFADDWEANPVTSYKRAYIWDSGDDIFGENNRNDWSVTYITIYTANVILETLDRGKIVGGTTREKEDIYGQALFFRSFAFYNLLQHFAKEWDVEHAHSDLGIALRLSSDLNIPTTRATVKDCYEQILADLKKASELLNEVTTFTSRPTKVAANALLARVSLSVADYDEALIYSNRALKMKSNLLDYNTVDASLEFPFIRFKNDEVLFHSLIMTPAAMYPPALQVDTVLMSLYHERDLRKQLLFKKNEITDSYNYYGSYDGSVVLFNGLTSAEMYLTRAECYARSGRTDLAVADLRTLLLKRWDKGFDLEVLEPSTPAEALKLVLDERRKELVFRGVRWSDLRRLNKEPELAVTLKRVVGGQSYTLPPNDNRYAFPIPPDVIEITGVPQNQR